VIDAPGPWGTGPFTLVEGYSSISTRNAIMKADPYTCTWLIESEDRSPRLVLEANRNHWNHERLPRLERVVFRADLSPAEALEACVSGDGEVDIVTELSPADAARVKASEHADLLAFDANRVLVGIINRYPSDAPLGDARVRRALNMAVDRDKLIAQGLGGYANPLRALTPAWYDSLPRDAKPYPHDPDQAKRLMDEAGWPRERPLRIAAPEPFMGLARMVAADVEAALGIATAVMTISNPEMRAAIEKKLPPAWDVLLHGWFDLSSEAPPAAVHREFFGADGAFRVGPELPEFDQLYAEMTVQLDGAKLGEVAGRIDTYAYDEALALFLCAPQALYAVNKHVQFNAYRTTLELAETTVDEGHWSRRPRSGETAPAQSEPASSGPSATGFHGAGC